MRRSVLITAKGSLVLLLLFYSVTFFGCGFSKTPKLYIYCNETFWYVMQEEALHFNRIYGFQIVLVPIRTTQTPRVVEETVEVSGDRRAPAQWRSRPREQEQRDSVRPAPHGAIHADIERQIERIAEVGFGDLFLSDSQKHLAKLQELALSVNEFPICYLTLTMLVPKGNRHELRSAKEVLETSRTLGIVDPSVDGLGEVSWKMLGTIVPGGETAIPMEHVRVYERQYDLLEALEQGEIDAALVWNATSLANFLLIKYADEYNAENKSLMREAERKKDYESLRIILQNMYDDLIETKSFAEEVPLIDNPGERCVVAVPLVALGTATRYSHCERFADFMRSRQSRDILRRFGFVAK